MFNVRYPGLTASVLDAGPTPAGVTAAMENEYHRPGLKPPTT
jgi:hypothetical protein